jgi:hypothetical protein
MLLTAPGKMAPLAHTRTTARVNTPRTLPLRARDGPRQRMSDPGNHRIADPMGHLRSLMALLASTIIKHALNQKAGLTLPVSPDIAHPTARLVWAMNVGLTRMLRGKQAALASILPMAHSDHHVSRQARQIPIAALSAPHASRRIPLLPHLAAHSGLRAPRRTMRLGATITRSALRASNRTRAHLTRHARLRTRPGNASALTGDNSTANRPRRAAMTIIHAGKVAQAHNTRMRLSATRMHPNNLAGHSSKAIMSALQITRTLSKRLDPPRLIPGL